MLRRSPVSGYPSSLKGSVASQRPPSYDRTQSILRSMKNGVESGIRRNHSSRPHLTARAAPQPVGGSAARKRKGWRETRVHLTLHGTPPPRTRLDGPVPQCVHVRVHGKQGRMAVARRRSLRSGSTDLPGQDGVWSCWSAGPSGALRWKQHGWNKPSSIPVCTVVSSAPLPISRRMCPSLEQGHGTCIGVINS